MSLKICIKIIALTLLNTSLVAKDRKKGVANVEKYLFLFLRALRGLKRCKKNCL
jgi:hypothetical protein